MNYLNLEIQKLNSERVKGSNPVERGTWLMLLAYCAQQENGGRIADCRSWICRKWQQLAAVTLKEVKLKCDLWEWDGDDLIVWEYPSAQEDEIRQKRERARANGKRGGRPSVTNVETENKTDRKPTLVPTSESVKEGKEREGNRKGITPTPPTREQRAPTVEDCEAYACDMLPAQKQWAAGVARQFHAMFSVKNWLTQSNVDLLEGQAWKHRLRQMIEEEARKGGGRGRGSAPPQTDHRPGNNLGDSTSLEGL